MAAEHTTREPGSSTNGDHTNDSHNLYPVAKAVCYHSCSHDLGEPMELERICFHCDNQAIALAWQGKSSKQPKLTTLLRKLFFIAAQNNFTVIIKHLPGTKNCIADAISRM